MSRLSFALCCLVLVCVGCGGSPTTPASTDSAAPATFTKPTPPKITRDAALRLGTTFHSYDPAKKYALEVKSLEIPDFPGSYAIWAGTGRNDAGDIFMGACATWTKEAPTPSVRLLRFNPEKNEFALAGDAVGMLQQLKLHREEELELNGEGVPVKSGETGKKTLCRECQMKIHTKLIAMDDGYLYFASMDEWAEKDDGSRPPYWGSHLWHIKANDTKWEHLAKMPGGVIAAGGVGRYLFLLGYYGHVVYCFDTITSELKQKTLGSYQGHISRNFLADANGHAYVPRITELPKSDDAKPKAKPEFKVELVELDHSLNEVAATPLTHYTVTGDADSHGITGIAYLADASLAFTTADGFLYRILPHADKSAEVREVGWFHPNGIAYAPSLHCLDGQRFLAGIASKKQGGVFDWVVYDLEKQESHHEPFPIRDDPAENIRNLNLYGSNTRDNQGRFYLVGNYYHPAKQRELPMCLQVSLIEQP